MPTRSVAQLANGGLSEKVELGLRRVGDRHLAWLEGMPVLSGGSEAAQAPSPISPRTCSPALATRTRGNRGTGGGNRTPTGQNRA